MALLGVTGCSNVSAMFQPEPDPSVKLAGIFLNAGAPDAALRAADEALTRQPRSTAALQARADALARGIGTQQIAAARPAPTPPRALAAITPPPAPAAAPPVAAPLAAAPPVAAPIVAAPPAAPPVAAAPIAAPVPVAALAVPAASVAAVPQAPPDAAPQATASATTERPAEPLRPTGIPMAMPIALGTASIAPRSASPAARPGAAYAQLAMAQSAGRARTRWEEIRTSQESLLRDRRPVIAASSFRDQAVWAVRTGPFATPRQAENFCLQLRNAGQDCWAVVPTPDEPAAEIAAPIAIAQAVAAAPPSPAPVQAAERTPAATPAAVPAAAPVASAQPATPEPPAGRGAFAQLAAADSAAGVEGEWERLRRKIGPLLQDRQQITQTAEVGGRQVWRLRTGPFQQPREAEAFCAEVRAAGGKCWSGAGS